MTDPGLSIREKLSYGLGDLAANLSWNLISGFLLFFYVNVALIPVAMAGTLMLVSLVLSASLDPVIGILVDRTDSRYGKTRPWLLYGAVPLGACSFLLFLSPAYSAAGKIVYAYATLIGVELLYAAVSIPYGTMMPLMTRDPNQKMQLSSLRTVGSSVGTFMATGLTMPIVSMFGSDHSKGFAWAGGIFATALTLMFLIVFKNCKERYKDPFTSQKGVMGKAFLNLARNPSWRVTFAFALLMLMRLGALIASTAFFCINVLHEPRLISVLLPILSVASLCSAPLAPAYFKRLGIRWGNILLLLAGAAVFATLPFVESNRWAFLAVYSVSAFLSVGACTTSIFAMAANSVDHQQWLYGMRNDGLVYSSISISTKLGIAAGTSLVAYVLAWFGFDALHPSASAVGAIRVVYYGAPLVLLVLQAICVGFYGLDKMHPQIVADLNARSRMAAEIHGLDGAAHIEAN